jgi:hypothetical protein
LSSFHEFHEPIAVETPLGPGRAILVERTQHDYFWTVALATCAIVTFTQDKIRICKSYTHTRGISDERMKQIIGGASSKEAVNFEPGGVKWQHY